MSELEGMTRLLRELEGLEEHAPAIARAAVGAGLSTLARAARTAAVGTIKTETGWYIRQTTNRIWGRAGLMQFANPGDKDAPHGLFLDIGTKYITARHNISKAMIDALPKAIRAAERAAERKIKSIRNAL